MIANEDGEAKEEAKNLSNYGIDMFLESKQSESSVTKQDTTRRQYLNI